MFFDFKIVERISNYLKCHFVHSFLETNVLHFIGKFLFDRSLNVSHSLWFLRDCTLYSYCGLTPNQPHNMKRLLLFDVITDLTRNNFVVEVT